MFPIRYFAPRYFSQKFWGRTPRGKLILFVGASWARRKRKRKTRLEYEWEYNKTKLLEEAELKRSEMLEKQLQGVQLENRALLSVINGIEVERLEQQELANHLLGAVREIEAKIAPSIPEKPPIDIAKRTVLLERLEMARQAKEDRKLEQIGFEKRRNRNLAKARRAKAKRR